jgi:ribose transport system substrate-binding protein
MFGDRSNPRRRARHIRAASLLTLMVAGSTLVVACGSSSPGSPSSSSVPSSAPTTGSSAEVTKATVAAKLAEAASTKILQTTPLPRKPPTGKLFVYIADPIPANSQIGQTAELAASAVGWRFAKLSYTPGNPDTFQSALSTALSMHASVVGEAGVPASQFGASEIAAYKAADVPIVVTNLVPGTNSGDIYATPGSTYEVYGSKALADWFISDSQGKGDALVENAAVYPILTQFDSGFEAAVKENCTGCSTQNLVVPPDDITNGQLIPTVISRLRANPKFDYVVFDNGLFADGVSAQLDAAGLNKVKVIGTGMDPDGASAIKAGTESAWMSISYYYQGYSLMDAAFRVVEHVPGIAGDTAASQQLITSADIDQFGTGNYPPPDALQQFEKLWKVPVTSCTIEC